jgi:hypothetical protein
MLGRPKSYSRHGAWLWLQTLRRAFLRTLASKQQTEDEVKADIEWTLHEYTKAIHLHDLRADTGFFELYVIPTIEMAEHLVKLNWSKMAKGFLSVRKRQIERLEAEMKAPGRECAYVFDARERFGSKAI